MTPAEKLAALIEESGALAPAKDANRLREIYTEAATLVDRNEKPKKWAAFRFMYGQLAFPADPQAALDAFRESLPYWDPLQDRPQWAECKSYVGWSLAALGKVAPPESEEAIECLEATVGDYPDGNSQLLAGYYAGRTIGDPLDNWKKRIHYLELSLTQVSVEGDPVQWAKLKNDLALALPQEPDGDFAKATETRIGYHKEALAIVAPSKDVAGSAGQNCWILICLDTSEAYLSRVGTNAADDRKTAERYARAAYAACNAAVARNTRAFAAMGLARVLINEDGAEALALCEEADALIDTRAQPVIAATNQKFKAQAHLKLQQWEDLLKAADTAYALLDPILYSDMRRTVMQLAAEGLVTAGQFVRATGYLQRAVEAGEKTLEQATSRAGRLERIFDLHDSYARLGYCFFQANEIAKGIEALDRGKGRLWRPAKSFAAFAQIKALVPEGGALLFAAFAPNDGAVAVVTANGERVCPLNGFGREQLTELLLGDVRNPASGSWISRYVFRNSHPRQWLDAIDAIGPVLFESVWVPLMRTLSALGIQDDAELVWFPQAGLGVLPLHAAWRGHSEKRAWISETYAIRYAPSASSLLAGNARTANPHSLIVADPRGDLANSALEVHWARESKTAGEMTLLAGNAAAKETVMAELGRATLAHFSTHAVFRLDDPFKSSLLMAGGEILSLEELLPLLQTSPLREVILSGCETAMAQVARRPDELLGFPAAFLEHGAATVVATQWPVDDWAAAALIGRFYRERSTKTAGQAMRAAQNWMREVTAGELSELLRPLKREPGPVGEAAAEIRTSLAALDPAARPFAHPYFWAGFTVSGGG